ncbi:hypothetical protein PC120_g27586 [Phytophthora cactorum]|nr:hypothetical protein PC120_g27586 [Phytophthora cactorum]
MMGRCLRYEGLRDTWVSQYPVENPVECIQQEYPVDLEAEYIALSLAIQEGKWIHHLLCEILAATNETGPELKIREDNQSCIKMTKNPVNHGRAKHIDIKYHHIRDEVKRGEVKLEYCETSLMLADIMTKALPGPRHMDLTTALGIHACSH